MKLSKGVWTGLSAGVAAAVVAGGAAAVYLVPSGGSHTAQNDAVNVVPAAAAQQLTPIPVQQVLDTNAATKAPYGIQARTAFLLDIGKNKALWGKGADTRLPIGSMTKVMTALVVLQQGNLDRPITIKSSYTTRVLAPLYGSSASLRVGDRITPRELLYALMLPSGCDAAAALADAYGPGYNGFVKKMNSLAAKLHLRNTHYANFDGQSWTVDNRQWTKVEAWSTARDQVTLGQYAMKNATFRAVVNTAYHPVAATSAHHAYTTWKTTNHILGRYPGVNGIKTGHTDLAGYCFLFSDVRKGHNLIGVVLGDGTQAAQAENRFADARRMLDWALHTKTVYSLDKAAEGLPSD
jgi:D-alanyl-D-alanine carboxypeptidase (penicillin-binding protein 5/6)